MTKIAFEEQPPIGTVLMMDAQAFEMIGTEPYQRADGQITTLLVWKSNCPTCGVEFRATSTFRGSAPRRRCEQHAGRGKISRRRKGGVRIQVIEA